jgi:hypothetical protein
MAVQWRPWRIGDRQVPLPAFEARDLTAMGLVFGAAGVLLAVAVLRGTAGVALYEVVPSHVWVCAFAIGGLSLAGGLLIRLHHAVWFGNGLLGTAYLSMWAGLLAVDHARPFVYSAVFLPFAVVHGFAFFRLGYRMPPANEIELVERPHDT